MNLQNTLVKGALMLALTSILSALTNLPETGTDWLVFLFTTVGTLAGYFAQSALFPTTSETGQLNGKDLLKALLVALSNGLSTWGATLVEGQAIEWKGLLVSMVGIFAGYLLKNLNTAAPKS